MQSLPLIDVSGLRTGDHALRKQLADDIGRAAREIGFFRIYGHGISQDLIAETYEAAEQFFALSDRTKRRYYIGLSSNHRGYVPFTEKGDYPDEVNRSYEAFDLGLDLPNDDPDFLAGNRILGPNVWPEVDGFKETILRYYNEISVLGRQVCSCLELYLGLPPGAMTDQMSKPISQLRLLHYVRQAGIRDYKSVNMGAHTDYECLTLLHTRNEGLQVMTQDDHWIDVPVDLNVFVVNVGDMLEAWSNGVLRSTPHRVLNHSPERFSLPYFVATNYNTMIKPFSQLVKVSEKPKYDPFIAGEHLERMLIRDFPYLQEKGISESFDGASKSSIANKNPFENRINGAPIKTCLP